MILSVKSLFDEYPSRTYSSDELSQSAIVDALDHEKGVLIRREDEPLSVEEFGRLLVKLDLERYPYVGGAAPRTIIPVSVGEDIIFTANERYVCERQRPSNQCRHLTKIILTQSSKRTHSLPSRTCSNAKPTRIHLLLLRYTGR